mmetsp:Transcript_108547/g.346477  ORF Transcript_108547/g.346477 Transcript_108547/m.346477 type:complete len:215 (-) Transcript_108547:453-1097(-)
MRIGPRGLPVATSLMTQVEMELPTSDFFGTKSSRAMLAQPPGATGMSSTSGSPRLSPDSCTSMLVGGQEVWPWFSTVTAYTIGKGSWFASTFARPTRKACWQPNRSSSARNSLLTSLQAAGSSEQPTSTPAISGSLRRTLADMFGSRAWAECSSSKVFAARSRSARAWSSAASFKERSCLRKSTRYCEARCSSLSSARNPLMISWKRATSVDLL